MLCILRGTPLATGVAKKARETGLVTHTHQLLRGLARRYPGVRLAVTQTGGVAGQPVDKLLTPEGLTVNLRCIATGFPEYLRGPGGGKSRQLVRRYYEDEIDDPHNPVWRSLAEQYAQVIRDAGTADLLLQNINPLVSVLKAGEFGLLASGPQGGLNITSVVHDGMDAERRFAFLARRAECCGENLKLIAVSESVRQALIGCGVPGHAVRVVINGLDVSDFQERLRQARAGHVFERVRERNNLPAGCRAACFFLMN